MRLKLFLMLIGISIIVMACQEKTEQKANENLNPNTHKVIVLEVINANTYTYLKVKEKNIEYWLAIAKKDINKGKTYYYSNGLEMKNFKSKELKRTFETIYFVNELFDKPLTSMKNMPMQSPGIKKTALQKEDISIQPVKGGMTIAELFSNRNSYSGKIVKIKGQIVKFNPNIMGRNWIHLQDGSKDNENFDLTITTNESVKVGDVVIFEGEIALNKDFGAGYSYEVIMEKAKLQNE